MKKIIHTIVVFLFCSTASGQKIRVLLQGSDADSSFYDILKIRENEFWIAGEYGILKSVDSSGKISSVAFPNEGLSILKLLKVDQYVFIATTEGVIYRYDINKKTFFKKAFPEYKGKCFYDIIVLKNGKLMVCGGNNAIARNKKRIPFGFIALLDQDLQEIKKIWNNNRKFVWSILQLENENILAVSYNGFNTFIIRTDNLKSWRKEFSIKGLIHKIALFDFEIWYCGAKNIRFIKDGIVGKIARDSKVMQYNGSGCLWSMNASGEKMFSVTQNGELLKLNIEVQKTEKIKIPNAYALYDFENISRNKILTVGHGMCAYIIDFD